MSTITEQPAPDAAGKPADAGVPEALKAFDMLPDSAHVRLPVVKGLHGVSAPTIWRWVKAGRLPAPKKLGPNTTAWLVGDLRAARRAAQGTAA